MFCFFQTDDIYLVVNIKTIDIFSVSLNNVDKIINIPIFSEQDISIVNLVFMEHLSYSIFLDLREFTNGINQYSSGCFLFDGDLGRMSIQSNSYFFQFLCQLHFLFLGLSDIQNHQNKIGTLSNGYDLTTTTLSLSSTFNNTRKIEQLDISVINFENSRDTSQGCKFVSGALRFRCRDSRQYSGFSYTRKTNHYNPSFTTLRYFKPFSSLCSLGRFV
mmetsp:Transcript_1625/g.1734  ORF Transcript_1625/g.1734 Transcript_1625/m.1734 type:complete len:217 (-) Transcript_1625:145-795(-)